jgi:hypothetical protein
LFVNENKYLKIGIVRMTERSFAGIENRMWFGVVSSVMDPDKEGRVQVRIHGKHDDETNIPNEMLPWSKPMQSVTSAAHNKIGHAPVGAIVGTSVFGFYLDADQQSYAFRNFRQGWRCFFYRNIGRFRNYDGGNQFNPSRHQISK